MIIDGDAFMIIRLSDEGGFSCLQEAYRDYFIRAPINLQYKIKTSIDIVA